MLLCNDTTLFHVALELQKWANTHHSHLSPLYNTHTHTHAEAVLMAVSPARPRRAAAAVRRLTARRFNARRCTQLPAQDFLIRAGDSAPASPGNKSPSLSGALPQASLCGISLSAGWWSSPDILNQERVCVCVWVSVSVCADLLDKGGVKPGWNIFVCVKL